ncbi:MAG: hypothetical protein LBS00_08715 [Synergistaceae bacterium]|nr:hypothetical protein [Synergistaceae bacterium]
MYFVSNYILALCVLTPLFFSKYFTEENPLSQENDEPRVMFRLFLAFLVFLTYVWALFALWGYCILRYTTESSAPVAAALWGMLLVIAPLRGLNSHIIFPENLVAYIRFVEFFTSAEFIIAFISIKGFGSFAGPIIWTYSIGWILGVLGTVIFVMMMNRELDDEPENESQFENRPKIKRDFEGLGGFEEEVIERDFEESDLDFADLNAEDRDIEEHEADYFGIKMYWTQTVPRTRGSKRSRGFGMGSS